MNELYGAGIGALFGLASGIGGYFKNSPDGDKFDIYRLAPTAVISMIAGAYLGFTGQPLSETAWQASLAGLASVGFTELVSNWFKALKRRV